MSRERLGRGRVEGEGRSGGPRRAPWGAWRTPRSRYPPLQAAARRYLDNRNYGGRLGFHGILIVNLRPPSVSSAVMKRISSLACGSASRAWPPPSHAFSAVCQMLLLANLLYF